MSTTIVRQAASTFPANATQEAHVGMSTRQGDLATHKFVRDIFFSNLPAPLQKLRTYLWLVVLTRALGAEGFGAWSLFMVTLSMATTLATQNCGTSLMRFLSGEQSPSDVNRAYSTVMAMVGGVAVVVAFFFIVFSRQMTSLIFRSGRDYRLIVILGLALVCDGVFEEMKNLLRARRLNFQWAVFSIAKLIPEIFLTIAVAWLLRSVIAVSWTYMAVGAGGVVAGTVYLRTRQQVRLGRPSALVFRKYAMFGLPLLPGVLASAVSFGADKYMVSYYLGLRQAGIYSVCFTLAAATFFLMGPINDVLFPELSALHDTHRKESFDRRFSGIQRFVFGLSVGAAALLTAFPGQILRIFSSGEFSSGSATLAVLGVQGIFMALVLLYVVILNVRLRVFASSFFWIVSGAGIIFLDVLLIPRFGIAGAAASQLICTAAGAIVLIILHWELFRRTFPPVWILQTGVGFAAVCTIGVLWPEKSGDFAASFLQIAFGACVFLFCLFVTGFTNSNDICVLKSAFFHAR